jgi:hypothetical protein
MIDQLQRFLLLGATLFIVFVIFSIALTDWRRRTESRRWDPSRSPARSDRP